VAGSPVATAGPRLGRVRAFDKARGLGTVVDDDGVEFDFHATAIADGSRSIEVHAAVMFVIAPAHRGRYEARSLVPLPAATRPASAG
jgi:cold shock CspA family protein